MQQGEEVVYLYLDDIIPNRFQPREVFDERPLKELAVSIKEHGVIQPIIVRKVNDKYEIIAGERRYKAAALAGLTKIPAIIRDLDDKETSKVALLENLQRKNLNPLEEAKTYQKILEIDEMTQEDLAKTMGKSQSAVSNKLRLLSLTDEVQEALLKEEISERHARALLNVEDGEKQKQLLKEIIEKKMTVRQLEARIKEEQEPEKESGISELPDNIENNEDIPKDIDSSTSFLSSNPLIPNFEDKDETSNEPLLINNSEESNSQNLTNDSKEQNSEPLIMMPNNESQPENDTDSKESQQEENEPLIVMENKDNTNNKTQSNETSSNKYINFGEIDDDDDEEDDPEKFYDNVEETPSNISFGEGPISANTAIDINDLKKNTKDINLKEPDKSGADLDSLLRLNTPIPQTTDKPDDNSFKFFSPAAEALKESEQKEEPKSSEDYFKAPDLINVELPGEVPTYNTNNVPLSSNDDNIKEKVPTENKMDAAIEIINKSLSKVEELGIKVEKDEMNLQKSYQVIIKLEKQD